MVEYIERETAIAMIRENGVRGSGWSNQEREDNVVDMIESIPAADVRPVVRGEWEEVEVIENDDRAFDMIASMRCNKCNRYHNEVYHYGRPTGMAHFCPNCGAVMEES